MVWVVERRSAGKKQTWKQWSASAVGSDTLTAGIEMFMAWREMRRAKERQIAGEPEQTATAPLE